MNQSQVYICPPNSEPLSHIPPHPPPLGCPRVPALGALHHALNLHWSSVSRMVCTYFRAILSHHPPSPSPTESKSLFFTLVSPLLSCMQDHHYRLSKFHIYVCIIHIYMEFHTYVPYKYIYQFSSVHLLSRVQLFVTP